VQRHVEILGRHREQVLGEALARVGVEIAADDAANVSELVGAQAGAAAEHHVLQGVRRSGKPHGRFVRADQVIHRGRDHRRQARLRTMTTRRPLVSRGAQYPVSCAALSAARAGVSAAAAQEQNSGIRAASGARRGRRR